MLPLDNYNLLITVLVLLLHLILLLLAVLLGRHRKRPLSGGEILFCAVVPLFGPVCGLELIYAEEPDPELLRDRVMNPDPMRKSYTAPDPEAPSTAPMEEAFLISEPAVRREMMMKLLHDDPEKNVELLMIARFNDDPETAHYATATLTEYQRQTEMSLQQSQALLAKDPDSTANRLAYIHQMETYIASGLLEGHLLLRQRTLLEQEIAKVPAEDADLALGCLRCRNLLALGKAREASEAARELTRRYPGEEEPWLELMRVCVDSRDAQGLRAVGKELETAGVLWSYAGREKMDYFLKGST